MAEIHFPEKIPPVHSPERVERPQGDTSREKGGKREHPHPSGDGAPAPGPNGESAPQSGVDVEACSAMEREVRDAILRLRQLSGTLLDHGMSAHEDVARELVRLEGDVHVWLSRKNRDDAGTLKALILFRSQLRTLLDLLTDNMTFLRGTLEVSGLAPVTIYPGTVQEGARRSGSFDFREGR